MFSLRCRSYGGEHVYNSKCIYLKNAMVVVQLLTVMNGYLLHNNNRLRLKLIVQSPSKCSLTSPTPQQLR